MSSQSDIVERLWTELDQHRKEFKQYSNGFSVDFRSISESILKLEMDNQNQRSTMDKILEEIRYMRSDIEKEVADNKEGLEAKIDALQKKHTQIIMRLTIAFTFISGFMASTGSKVWGMIGKLFMGVM